MPLQRFGMRVEPETSLRCLACPNSSAFPDVNCPGNFQKQMVAFLASQEAPGLTRYREIGTYR